jgi:hypothetical protein
MWRGVARVYVIGLTGNIATGKSTVGRMLADLGALYIDADEIAHDVIARGGAAFADVVAPASWTPTVRLTGDGSGTSSLRTQRACDSWRRSCIRRYRCAFWGLWRVPART